MSLILNILFCAIDFLIYFQRLNSKPGNYIATPYIGCADIQNGCPCYVSLCQAGYCRLTRLLVVPIEFNVRNKIDIFECIVLINLMNEGSVFLYLIDFIVLFLLMGVGSLHAND